LTLIVNLTYAYRRGVTAHWHELQSWHAAVMH
jgi:hypothetical protein